MYYKYKNNEYIVLNNKIKFKHPQTREWVSAVLYRSLSTGGDYVRELKEFYSLFTEFDRIQELKDRFKEILDDVWYKVDYDDHIFAVSNESYCNPDIFDLMLKIEYWWGSFDEKCTHFTTLDTCISDLEKL